jgi:hypothetical protein
MIDINKYPIHHVGIALTLEKFQEVTLNKEINHDKTQGVQTYFEKNDLFDCYIEYFTITGRAKNYKPGFNHVCYKLEEESDFEKFINKITETQTGIQLTELEKSGSPECNKVVFCYLSGIGIVEFNIDD